MFLTNIFVIYFLVKTVLKSWFSYFKKSDIIFHVRKSILLKPRLCGNDFLCFKIMSNCVVIFYPFWKPTFQQKSLQDMNLTRPLRFVSVLTVHLYKLSPFQTFILPNQSILLLTPGNVKINVGLPQTFVLYMLTIRVESCSRNKNERTTLLNIYNFF